jgi:hypothetical protein
MKTNRRNFIKFVLATIGAFLTRAHIVKGEKKEEPKYVVRPVLTILEEIPGPIPSWPTHGKMICLDPWSGDGDDTEGDGSPDKPFASMQRAIDEADPCALDFIIHFGKCVDPEKPITYTNAEMVSCDEETGAVTFKFEEAYNESA